MPPKLRKRQIQHAGCVRCHFFLQARCRRLDGRRRLVGGGSGINRDRNRLMSGSILPIARGLVGLGKGGQTLPCSTHARFTFCPDKRHTWVSIILHCPTTSTMRNPCHLRTGGAVTTPAKKRHINNATMCRKLPSWPRLRDMPPSSRPTPPIQGQWVSSSRHWEASKLASISSRESARS